MSDNRSVANSTLSSNLSLRAFAKRFFRVSLKHLAADAVVIVASLYLALYLRIGPEQFAQESNRLTVYLPFIVGIRVLVMALFGCYNVMWRYISTSDAVRLAQAVALSSAVIIAVTFFLPEQIQRLPRSVYIIEALLVGLGLMAARLYRRLLFESRAKKETSGGQRTLIIGAGENGRLLAHRFKSDPVLKLNIVGYVDDDPKKRDLIIQGTPVLGDRSILSELITRHQIAKVVIAIPNLKGDVLREIVIATRAHNIKPQLVATAYDTAKQSISVYREIDLGDLLNRAKAHLDLQATKALMNGKCVLVTGAGGSIGSELSRQILGFNPARLILLDHSEFNLYEIDSELRLATHDTQRVVPALVDLKDSHSLKQVFETYRPDIVVHAAAYKHVHLVEANPAPSIMNNISGTKNLLKLAEEFEVSTFLMISTDKAVNPAGIMGSTKRACEMLVTAAALRSGRQYTSVRFGNVLGSSGSLIPLLKSQVENGGPVTITHPEMTRFFMLIPEAVALVLKSMTLAKPGDVNVLKMGEPVRILDIAKSLIALMGRSESEVPIIFTGLRPGEKMFEELYIRGDELKTEHPDILTLPKGDLGDMTAPHDLIQLETQINSLINAAAVGDAKTVPLLNELVKSNYKPKADELRDTGIQLIASEGNADRVRKRANLGH